MSETTEVKLKKFVVVANGNHGPVRHPSVSNRMWRRMSLEEKFNVATDVSIEDVTFSLFCAGKSDKVGNDIKVKEWVEQDRNILPENLEFEKDSFLICTLSTAVWLKRHGKLDPSLILQIAGSIEMTGAQGKFPPLLTNEDLQERIRVLCQELVIDMSRDRVYSEPVEYEAQVFTAVRECGEKVSRICEDVIQTNLIGRVDSLIERFETDYQFILNHVRSFLTTMGSSVIRDGATALEFALILMDFVRGCIYDSMTQIVTACVRFCLRLGLDFEHSIGVLKFVGIVHARNSPSEENQGGDIDHLAYEAQGLRSASIIPFFIAFIGMLLIRQLPTKADIDSVHSALRSLNLAMPLSSNLAGILSSLPEFLPKVAQVWIEKLCPAEAWLRMFHEGFLEWSDECDEFLTVENEFLVKFDHVKQEKLQDLRERGKNYLRDGALNSMVSRTLFDLVSRHCKRLDNFQQILETANGMRGHRRVPFSICLYGLPKVGKTTLIKPIASVLCPINQPMNNLIYRRNAALKHWDAYTGQFCTVFDDIGQIKDQEDVAEFMMSISSDIFVLPMASVDDTTVGKKGTTMKSELVITTSNSSHPTFNQVNEPLAFWRRRHLLFEVAVRPEFVGQNGLVNFDAIPEVTKFSFNHLVWRMLDPIKESTPLGEWISTTAAFGIMQERYSRFMEEQDRLFALLEENTFANMMRARPMQEEVRQLIEAQGEFVAQGDMEDLLGPPAAQIREDNLGTWDKIRAELNLAREKVFEKFPALPSIMKFISGFAAALGVVSLFVWAINKKPQDVVVDTQEVYVLDVNKRKKRDHEIGDEQAEFLPSGDNSTRNPRARRLTRFAQGAMDVMQGDAAAISVVNDVIAPSMVNVTIKTDSYSNKMSGFAFGFDFLMFPRHFFLNQDGVLAPSGAKLSIVNANGVEYSTLFDVRNLTYLRRKDGTLRDVCVYKFGPRMRNFRNRVNLFVEEKDLGKIHQKPGILVGIREGKIWVHNVPSILELTKSVYYKFHGDKVLQVTTGWEYLAQTMQGDCGAMLVVCDNSIRGKICGLHIAGSPRGCKGIAEVILQHELQAVVEQYDILVEGLPKPSANIIGEFPRLLEAHGNFDVIGRLHPSERLRMPDKTEIKPSVIFEKISEHITEPAVLRPDDPRLVEPVSPLVKGIEKYGKQCEPFEKALLENIISDMYYEMLPVCGNMRVFPLDQAVNGIPGEEYIDALNMSTSPGWPFKTWKNCKEKRDLFEGEPPNAVVSNQDLLNRLLLREEAAKRGQRFPSAFADCLKDERRSLEKIRLGSTRVFAIAPIDFVILMRKYCLDFAARFYKFRHIGFSAVGINTESLEWDDMVQYLEECSDVGFAGDFSRFDGTLSADCVYATAVLINRLYKDGPVSARIRHVLFDELIHSVHVALDAAYVVCGGNPSGNPLTVVLNTIVNEMYLRYAWLKIVPPELASLRQYHKHVRTKVYGDDNWIAVSRSVVDFYNLRTVSKFLETMGIEFLSPDKVSSDFDVAPIRSWMFLKRYSVVNPAISNTRCVGALKWETILEMLNWIRKCDNESEACEENCNAALHYAFLHGKEKFDWLRKKICKAWLKAEGKIPKFVEYGELYKDFMKNNGFGDLWLAQGDIHIESASASDPKRNLPIQSQEGAVLTEQQPVVEEIATRGEKVDINARAKMRMQDRDWDLNAMVERFNYVGSISWSTANASGTELASYRIPKDLLKTRVSQGPFDRFVYWRGSPRIRFQLNGTRFHMGRLIAYYVPLTDSDTIDTWHKVNKVAQTSVQHIFLDPSNSTIAELKIPFVNWGHYLNIEEPDPNIDFLGYVRVAVFNPLQVVGAGVNPLKINVLASLEVPEFHVPGIVPFSTTLAREDALIEDARLAVATKMGKVLRKVEEEDVEFEAQGNTVSSKITNIYEKVGNVTAPMEVAGDKFDTVADVSAMDKINVPMQPPYVVLKPFGYLCHSENMEMLHRLTLKPSSLHLVDFEHFGTKRDEMELSYLFSLPTYEQTFNWTPSFGTGIILTQGYLAPCSRLFSGPLSNLTTAASVFWQPTLLDYCTLPHTFWRGSLKFHFDIVCTAFHTGRLWFGVHYGQQSVPVTFDLSNAQYGTYIDIGAGCHHFTYEVPFLCPYEYLRVPNGSHFRATFAEYILGTWSLRVVNVLAMPENVPTNVQVNMFVSGGDDYEVSGLYMHNVSWCPIQAQGDFRLHGQLDTAEPSNMQDRERAEVIGTRKIQKGSISHFGERYESVREIIRRYMITTLDAGRNPWTGLGNPEGTKMIYPILQTRHEVGIEIMRGTMGWYARIYRAWRGSVRFKIMYNVQSAKAPAYTGCARGFVMYDATVSGFQNTIAPTTTSIDEASFAFTLGLQGEGGAPTSFGGNNIAIKSGQLNWPFNANETINQGAFSWRSPPLDISRPEVGYSEIEVPFSTIYNILTTNVEDPVVLDVKKKAALVSPGVLWIGFIGDRNLMQEPTAELGYEIYTAAGDDFRFGLLLGPPTLRINYLDPQISFTFDQY